MMKPKKITLRFSFNKRSGEHRLFVDYESISGATVHLHNRGHQEILRQVSETLEKNGLSIGDYDVIVRPSPPVKVGQKQPEASPISTQTPTRGAPLGK